MSEQEAGEILERVPSGEYIFLPVDRVAFGPGCVEQLEGEVQRLGARRVLLVTTSSLTKTPLRDRVSKVLGDHLAATFSDVHQHTPSQTVVHLMDEAERQKADMIVSLGGGSTIDTVKASILAMARDTGTFLPHIALPTTLSAAEFSTIFGVTDEQTKVKSGGNSPWVTPRVVFLDVDLTEYTPDWLWYASGIRALDHAVETVYAPNHQPATDGPALEAIRLLFTYLPSSGGEQHSRAARQLCQIAAWLSFFGVANITLGMSHALGREIGPRYNVAHGFTSAVLLPKVMAYFLPSTLERQALIARAAGATRPEQTEAEAALQAPPAVEHLVQQVGLPQRLQDLGIPQEDLEQLAAGRQDVLRILQTAW